MFFFYREKVKSNWVEEIQDDVIEECSKYGGIVHLYIDQNAPEGIIYVKCPTMAIATAAIAGLNGRYFAGKMIQASFVPVAAYHKQFPDSVNATQILTPSFS